MPCEYKGDCLTRATMKQLETTTSDWCQLGGQPYESLSIANNVLNETYCNGNPTNCQTWKSRKDL